MTLGDDAESDPAHSSDHRTTGAHGSRGSTGAIRSPPRHESFLDGIRSRMRHLGKQMQPSAPRQQPQHHHQPQQQQHPSPQDAHPPSYAAAAQQAQKDEMKQKVSLGREVAELLGSVLDNLGEEDQVEHNEAAEIASELYKKARRLQRTIATALANGSIASEEDTFDALAVNDNLLEVIERGKGLSAETQETGEQQQQQHHHQQHQAYVAADASGQPTPGQQPYPHSQPPSGTGGQPQQLQPAYQPQSAHQPHPSQPALTAAAAGYPVAYEDEESQLAAALAESTRMAEEERKQVKKQEEDDVQKAINASLQEQESSSTGNNVGDAKPNQQLSADVGYQRVDESSTNEPPSEASMHALEENSRHQEQRQQQQQQQHHDGASSGYSEQTDDLIKFD